MSTGTLYRGLCLDCGDVWEENSAPVVCPECESLRVRILKVMQPGNRTAREGVSRCDCGSKYWENDRCVDCGTLHDPDRHDDKEQAKS